jgi:acyl-CoA reductase-like NAD-dependent aldehyde dehydrogenase
MSAHPMVINGKLVQAEGDKTAGVINPATGKEFETVPEASQNDVNAAVAAAKAAFPTWKKMPHSERSKCFLKFHELVEADKEKLAKALSQEQGKPFKPYAMGEVGMGIGKAKALSTPEYELKREDYATNEKGKAVAIYEARGVVVGICPWNFPVMIGINKMLVPACAGNTVVIKPSPFTPLATVMLSKYVAEAFPPGVINIVTGSNGVGQMLVEHPDVTTISFTGSNATGKKIMAGAAGSLKKVLLELGGNDPAIILPGSNVKEIAPQVFGKAMFNTGQVCIALKRLYVHSSQYDEMVSELAEIAEKKAKVVGDGLKEGTEYGPLNNKMQRDRVEELVNDAKENGARIVAGGGRANPEDAPDAYFFAPTIVADVTESTRLVCEEQFGPALPVLKYDSVDDAVERANNTQYGLGASVWGPKVDEAAEVAAKLQSGNIWINTHLGSGLDIDAPFGGVKESGIGKEGGGPASLKVFCDEKYLYIPASK